MALIDCDIHFPGVLKVSGRHGTYDLVFINKRNIIQAEPDDPDINIKNRIVRLPDLNLELHRERIRFRDADIPGIRVAWPQRGRVERVNIPRYNVMIYCKACIVENGEIHRNQWSINRCGSGYNVHTLWVLKWFAEDFPWITFPSIEMQVEGIIPASFARMAAGAGTGYGVL